MFTLPPIHRKKYYYIDRIGKQRHNWNKSFRFNSKILFKLIYYVLFLNNSSITFDDIAIKSKRFTPITTLLTDSIDAAAFFRVPIVR